MTIRENYGILVVKHLGGGSIKEWLGIIGVLLLSFGVPFAVCLIILCLTNSLFFSIAVGIIVFIVIQCICRAKEDKRIAKELEKRRKAGLRDVEPVIIPPKNPTIKCPMCGSLNTQRISATHKVVSTSLMGLASSDIGKQYECKNCKHKW